MKLLNILKTVGGTALRIAGYGGVVDAVNMILPADKKLPGNATANQVQASIDELPPDQKMAILDKQFDVEIEEIHAHTENLKTLAEVDKAGASTRPIIAFMMAGCVCFIILVMVSLIGYAIGTNKILMIKAINDIWPVLATLIGIPASVLTYYFGKRSKDKEGRMNLMAGKSPAVGLIGGIVKAIRS